MKKLILSELLLLFLATTFVTDSLPPGWYQQTLPVNKTINDIFFLDSLTGWVVTAGASSSSDTGYIMKTTNGGGNWLIQYKQIANFNAVQFPDIDTGYAGGGTGLAKFYKTTNGGMNWFIATSFGFITITDLFFVERDTGWICSDDPLGGGIYKTANGGVSWAQQLGASFSIKKLFFINSDTGWAGSADWKLYRTTNSGQVWELQYTSNGAVESIFFLNSLKGWIRGGTGNGVAYTTNGGLNWTSAQGDPAGYDMKFVNDSIGYSGMIDFKIMKSTNGGKNWGYQNSPIISNLSVSMLRTDTLHGWAGGIGFIKTTDGGGSITFTGIQQISSEIPSNYKLYQNYPNPFNPATNIKYEIMSNVKGEKSNSLPRLLGVKLVVYDITGREILQLVNEVQNPGTYQVEFSGEGLSSGVYFYKIIITAGKEVFSDVKKMLMLK